jgi:hypothetical protein
MTVFECENSYLFFTQVIRKVGDHDLGLRRNTILRWTTLLRWARSARLLLVFALICHFSERKDLTRDIDRDFFAVLKKIQSQICVSNRERDYERSKIDLQHPQHDRDHLDQGVHRDRDHERVHGRSLAYGPHRRYHLHRH